MLVSDIWKGVFLFTIIIIACVGFLYSGFSEYGVTPDPNFTKTYQTINTTMQELGIEGNATGAAAEAGKIVQTNPFILMGSTIMKVIKLPFRMMTMITNIVSAIATHLILPTWAVWALMIFIFTSIGFMIVSAALRRNI